MLKEHNLTCDVLVAGGGPAGVTAALAAARHGAKVILCQDRPVLGGNASSEVRMHIVGADQHGGRGRDGKTETREGGLLEEIRLENSVRNPQRCANMLDLILYEKCRAESNLQLMLNTTVTGAMVTDNTITHALAQRQSSEEAFRIAAKVFVDCTGDGRLGLEAGAAFRHGREAKAEFNEQYAPEVADKHTMGSSLLFTAKDYGRPMPFVAPPWVRKFTASDFKHRPISSIEYGYWWVEWGGELDTIADNEKIRDYLLETMLGVWDYIKNSGKGGNSANWALDWFGFLPGKRESRRFIGQHVLREADLLQSRAFDDAIAYGGWAIDIHPPQGVAAPDRPPFTPYKVPYIYDIPLRSCIARTLNNLMFAGRNISATHVAFASTRVMATCAVIGQGVGTAAAYSISSGLCPAALPENKAAVAEIQQHLLRDDVYLIGRTNADPADQARKAKVTASSFQEEGRPENVLSGQTRRVDTPNGALPARSNPGLHRWLSKPGDLPAWLELRWDQPVKLGQVQLIFDTAMHRELTLTQSGVKAAPQWGHPQPETVKDYDIQVQVGQAWQTVAKITGNYQRRQVHAFTPVSNVSALRINVLASNGVDHARVMEVRAY